jgi:hypothetical protein
MQQNRCISRFMVLTLKLPIGPVNIGFSSVGQFNIGTAKAAFISAASRLGRNSPARRQRSQETAAQRSSVAQVGNLLYPPTGSRQNVGFSNPRRIANPRYGRLPVCATGVAAPPRQVFPWLKKFDAGARRFIFGA